MCKLELRRHRSGNRWTSQRSSSPHLPQWCCNNNYYRMKTTSKRHVMCIMYYIMQHFEFCPCIRPEYLRYDIRTSTLKYCSFYNSVGNFTGKYEITFKEVKKKYWQNFFYKKLKLNYTHVLQYMSVRWCPFVPNVYIENKRWHCECLFPSSLWESQKLIFDYEFSILQYSCTISGVHFWYSPTIEKIF